MSLSLPDGPRKIAFTTLIGIFQSDPLLSRVVSSWRIWDGSDKNPLPSTTLMPCVGLRIVGGPVERLSTNDEGNGIPTVDIRTKPFLVVETWVSGTNADDSYDLSDAVDAVLFPDDQVTRAAIRERLWDVGITDWTPTKDVLPETLSGLLG